MAFRPRMRRPLLVGTAAVAATLLGAAPALAHQCVNASKNQSAGVQIVFNDMTGDISYISNGLERRIDRGLVDLETGEGFHGLMGLDFDGDGVVDVATWIVTPTGEIPLKAQWNGPACKGVVNWEQFMECQMAPV